MITHKTKIFTLSITSIICLIVDQLTKIAAVNLLKDTPPLSALGNIFRLEYAENTGAFLGMGAELPDWERYLLLTIFSSGILVGLLTYLMLKKDLHRMDLYGYGLILAGGGSNMIDRIRAGVVIDFLNIGIGDLRTGIFNIADMAIMLGLIFVLIAHFSGLKNRAPNQRSSAPKVSL